MAVQAIQIASISEVPDNSYWSPGGLRIRYSKVGNSLYDANNATADKQISPQTSYRTIVNPKAKERQTDYGHKNF